MQGQDSFYLRVSVCGCVHASKHFLFAHRHTHACTCTVALLHNSLVKLSLAPSVRISFIRASLFICWISIVFLLKKSKTHTFQTDRLFFVIGCLETQRQERKESHVQLQFPCWSNHFVLLFEISFRSVEVQVNMLLNGALYVTLHKMPLQTSTYIFIQ